MIEQTKKVVANTIINEVKSNIKKAEQKLIELDKAKADIKRYIADQKQLLGNYEEQDNGNSKK